MRCDGTLLSMTLLPRLAIAAVAAALSLSPLLPAQAAATVQERTTQLNKLFDSYWQDSLRHAPEEATAVGDKRYNDQWSNYSGAAFNAWVAREGTYLTQLGAISTDGLDTQTRLSVELLERSIVDDQESVRFKEWEMPVNQFNGPQTTIPQILAIMPLDDTKDYDNYIARLNKVPGLFAQVQEAMTLGADEHRTPPRLVMEQVVKQVTTLATVKPEDSPFLTPLSKFPKTVSAADQKRLRAEMTDAVARQVTPAYDRFRRFLVAQYLPATRTEPGISEIPDGVAYYDFRIRQSTTLRKSADEIHAIGVAEVARDEAEMLVIAKKLGYSDLKTFNAAIKADPKLHPTSPDALVAKYQAYLDGMRPKLPQLFGRLPKAPLVVMKVPAYMEAQQSAAYYQPGTPDGSRPGEVFVNTYHATDRGLQSVEAVAYHEGLPGHHLQGSIAQEVTGLPEFRKESYYTAYTEGWGLYSERLGKDVGFYQDPYSDYGRLEADIWRAIRLVVDTGVHSKHWTRQQMVDYFHDHSGIDETNIQSEVDRYIAWPAQALGYKMGQLKLIELRERSRQKLGPKFSLSDYHDLVLDSGALPLDVLERRVDTWIAAGGGKQ